jgi:hypothetical protein
MRKILLAAYSLFSLAFLPGIVLADIADPTYFPTGVYPNYLLFDPVVSTALVIGFCLCCLALIAGLVIVLIIINKKKK